MTSAVWRDSQIWKFAVFVCVITVAVVASTRSAHAQGAGEDIKRFDLHIKNGRLADNRKTIQIRRGDTLEMNWSADRPTVVHLHGHKPCRSRRVQPDASRSRHTAVPMPKAAATGC